MKKLVFLDAFVMNGRSLNDISDKEIFEMLEKGNKSVLVYDSIESYIRDFNLADAPSQECFYCRMVDFPE